MHSTDVRLPFSSDAVREESCVTVRETERRFDDYVDSTGNIALPDGVTLMSNLPRTHCRVLVICRHTGIWITREIDDGLAVELTWSQLGARLRAVGARLQQVTVAGRPGGDSGSARSGLRGRLLRRDPGRQHRGPAVRAGAARACRAVRGGDRRCRPSVVLTTTGAAEPVRAFLQTLAAKRRPRLIAVDAVPDAVGSTFTPAALDTDDIAYLQYTSGSTRTPAGVEISHRAVCTNVLQMAAAGGLDLDVRSVSWLPLYHDMGLMMIMFPALSGA